MANVINATSTGNGGLVSTGDDSGILNIQTNETTAITVDASQRVGIGTASPSAKLDVTTSTAGFATILTNTNGASDSNGLQIKSGTGSTEYNLRLSNTSGSTDFMVVKGNGNVGVGTTFPLARLNVSDSADGAHSGTIRLGDDGTYYGENLFRYNSSEYRIGVYPSGNMTFYATGSENMRLSSAGNLLVGTTSAGGSRMVVNGATGGTAVLAAVNSTGSGNQFGISSTLGSTANNTNSAHFQGSTSGVGNWYLFGNGTNGFTSDQRLKKNIETTRDGYLADICRLRVVKYNWRNDAEGTDKELGLIAQEVEQVFPRLVQDDLNKISPDDDTLYKTLKGSVIPYMLLKAIQELKTINDTQAETINALTARMVALEQA